jgi:hypothetical protein
MNSTHIYAICFFGAVGHCIKSSVDRFYGVVGHTNRPKKRYFKKWFLLELKFNVFGLKFEIIAGI